MKFNVSQSNRVSSQQQRSGFAARSLSPLQAGKWVSLQAPLSPLSHDEALLLCQVDENRWTAWVPEYGEATLEVGQFRL